MTKRAISAILALTMLFMTACGDSSSDTKSSSKSESSSSVETTTTTASQSETETTTTTTAETTTTTTTTTQETTTAQQTSKIERVGIPYDAAKIITANANAKLIFTTLNFTATDCVIDNIDVDSVKTDGVVSVETFKDSTDPLKKAVYEAFNKTGTTNYGYVFIHFDPFVDDGTEQTPNFVQWSEDPTGTYIGQYLNPVDATNWSTIQFGTMQK